MVRSLAGGAGLLLAAASALSMAVAPPGADADWPRFRSERGRFAVQLPASPEQIRGTRVTLGGRVRWSEYRAMRGATEFRVEHHDLPWLAELVLSPDALLERATDSLVSEEHAHELSSSAGSVQGHPAREVSFRVPAEEPLAGDALLVLVGRRLYLLGTLGPEAEHDPAVLDRFFRSFEISEP